MKKGQKLLIVESPAKIKTISKFLGSDFTILSTFGHIIDLPSRKLGVTIEKDGAINLEYVPLKDKKKVIDEICKVAKNAVEVYLASDPDREGEIIAWHIGNEIAKATKGSTKMYRITFNEITKSAILEAIKNKSSIDLNKVQAQQARRILDRWVGYEVSPMLWRKFRKGLSAGRVQSAALLLICKREEEIVQFKPEESWSIHGLFSYTKQKMAAELAKIKSKNFTLKNKEEADKVLADIKKHAYSITDITDKKRTKNPHAPFMTSTLQQAAFNTLGYSVDKTMLIAQKLYEGVPLGDGAPHALITYMRTDSLRIADSALQSVRSYISSEFGADYLPSKAHVYSPKTAGQDAHEAIRPIDVTVTPQKVAHYLPKDQAKLYELIWCRFVACQMTPAEFLQRQVSIEGGPYMFRITGSTLTFDGFLKVYQEEEEEAEKAVKIPNGIEKGMALGLEKVESKQHFTQPPPRYNESSLVKEMEKQGIGRPSTYAATLSTIQKREYTTKDKKRFMPTELGKSVNALLASHLPDIINLTFTAKMEENLDKIAQGDIGRDIVLHDFYTTFQKELKKFAEEIKGGKQAVATDVVCPKCKEHNLVIRFGKAGEFIGCSSYPNCTFTSNFIRTENGGIELMTPPSVETHSELTCPNCGKLLVQRMGRFGPFFACPGYPTCKYIHQDSLKMACLNCGGKIVKRISKRGSFWGCSSYPKCTFALYGDPIEKKCPKCASPYLLEIRKGENILIKCPQNSCGFSQEG